MHLNLQSSNHQDKKVDVDSEKEQQVIEINENVQARRLELSPIIKDPLLASSRDGRDTERDNLLLQKIGLQSAKKSEKEAIKRKLEE